MKIISLEQTQEYKNSELCIATEYNFKDKDIDISTAEINGKYPEIENKFLRIFMKNKKDEKWFF